MSVGICHRDEAPGTNNPHKKKVCLLEAALNAHLGAGVAPYSIGSTTAV